MNDTHPQPGESVVSVAWEPRSIDLRRLPPAADSKAFQLHLAALDWRLIDPIIINSAKELKGVGKWQERELKPFEHQIKNLMTFCRRLPVTLIADDVGLGKTITAGLIVSELLARRRIAKILVICPSLLLPQWKEELASKFGISSDIARGQDFDGALRAVIHGTAQVAITTYHTARSRFDAIQRVGFDMLILDEAHKLRNLHGTPKAPLFAERIRSALAARLFKYVLMLTATPIQNRLWDMYSLIDCLTVAKGHKNPFGDPEDFKERFIGDQAARHLAPGTVAEFRAILSQYIARTRHVDAKLPFPERAVRKRSTAPTNSELALFTLAGQIFQSLNPLQQTSLGQALMSSPHAFAAQLENMTQSVPRDVIDQAREIAQQTPRPAKLEALQLLCQELRAQSPETWRVVVFTGRRETQRLIATTLRQLGIRCGTISGGDYATNQKSLKDFRNKPPLANVLVSTDTGAEGVNLQVANVVVNYDLPWNPMVLEQRIGRAQRLGSDHATVQVVNLVLKGSIEERVVGRLMEKLAVVAQTIGDIEAILETVGLEDDAEGGESSSFNAVIRKLVADALRGKDVAASTKMIEESIDNAKTTLEDNRDYLETTLGSLDSLHKTGPTMPKLSRRPPRLTAEQFILDGLAYRGASIDDDPRGKRATYPSGESFPFTFEADGLDGGEHHVFGPALRRYVPGQTHFERVVQKWSDEHAAFVKEIVDGPEAHEALAKQYLSRIDDAQLATVRELGGDSRFAGTATSYVRASVAHDSFEKLVECKLGDGALNLDGPADALGGPLVSSEVRLGALSPAAEATIRRSVQQDADVGKFCDFYLRRLDEERPQADVYRRKQIENDLSPNVLAELSAVEGYTYRVVKLSIGFTVREHGPFTVQVTGIPASSSIIDPPEHSACEVSGRSLPVVCLVTCEISKKRVFVGLTTKSEATGRVALREFATACPVSGVTVLNDELVTSAVSGKVAAPALFVRSGVSGCWMLRDEAVKCEFTDAPLMPSEAVASDASGKLYRCDQTATSAISGKTGHKSEFVTCQESRDVILPDESGVSAYSSRRVRRDLLVPSELEPHRLGLASETGTCAATSRRLLRDELTQSEVSGRTVGRDALVKSSTGRIGLPDEIVTCSETGKLLLSDEVRQCAISGAAADAKLFRKSALSGREALARLLVESEKSGRRALPDEMVTCTETGKQLIKDEVLTCAESDVVADKTLFGTSDLSGKQVLARLLKKSKESGRRGLPAEMVTCSETGDLLFPDEVSTCSASGAVANARLFASSAISKKRVLARLLEPSAVSARRALPDELVVCAETGAKLFPDEVFKCEATGRIVDARQGGVSDLSGRRVLTRLLQKSAISGRHGAPGEMVVCQLSNEVVAPDETEVCAASGKRSRRDRMVQSAVSQRWYVPSESVQSAASGRPCGRSEAVECEWSRELLLPDELGRCGLTAIRVGKRDLNRSGVLNALAEVMDGKVEPALLNRAVVAWAQGISNEPFSGAHDVRLVAGRVADVALAFFELRSFLGWKKRWIGAILDIGGREPRILGDSVVLARRGGRFVLSR